jgi:hypothetical protein
MMCEIAYVLLGLLSGLQIADSDNVVRPSSKIDRPQDQLDWRHQAIEMAQFRFNGLAGSRQQFSASNRVRETALELCPDKVGSR